MKRILCCGCGAVPSMFKHLFRSYLESSLNVCTDDNLWKSNFWKKLKKKNTHFLCTFHPLTSESKAWNDLKLSEKIGLIKPLSRNLTKWLITLKQFVRSLQKNCLSVWLFCGVGTKGLGFTSYLTIMNKVQSLSLLPSSNEKFF